MNRQPLMTRAGCVVIIGSLIVPVLLIGRLFVNEMRGLPTEFIFLVGLAIIFLGIGMGAKSRR